MMRWSICRPNGEACRLHWIFLTAALVASRMIYFTVRYDTSRPSAPVDLDSTIPTLLANTGPSDSSLIQQHHGLCLTQECIDQTAAQIARAFPDRMDRNWVLLGQNISHLIDPTTNATYESAGILYVKNFKAASSTAAGVAYRLASRLPQQMIKSDIKNQHASTVSSRTTPPVVAWVRAHHTKGSTYRNHHPRNSFLFTSVRDPASRAMSRIFYTYVTQFSYSTQDETILKLLNSTDSQYGSVRHVGGGYQVWYLSLEKKPLEKSWTANEPSTVQQPMAVQAAVAQILQDYDFILVAERLDESIVAMSMILNVSIADILLVQDAKASTSNSWYYFQSGKMKREVCKRPVAAFRSPRIAHYLESIEWRVKNYGDYLLHSAAIQSLELTIERIGQHRFQQRLQEYRDWKRLISQECNNQTIYHCSDDGVPQRHLSKANCYYDDSGCGYPCVDAYLQAIR